MIIGGGKVRVLSLFDGIACGRVALERAGIKVDKYYASEIDENAIKIALSNYPDINEIGNVKYIKSFNFGKIDLLIGGSPCQDLSRNGHHAGLQGDQSGLFFEYLYVLSMLRKNNPHIYFLLENVEMSKENEDIITQALNVEPIKINSKYFSAQNRPRVYWTNITIQDYKDKGITILDIIDKSGCHEKPTDNELSLIVNKQNYKLDIKQPTKAGFITAEHGDGINLTFPTSKTRRGRVTHGKSATLDCQCNLCFNYKGHVLKFNRLECERLQTLPDGYTSVIDNDKIAKKAIGNGWTVDVITHIFKGLGGDTKC